jgi:hypothetical protein
MKHCYSQIAYECQYRHIYVRVVMFLSVNLSLVLLFASLNPLRITRPRVYLEIPFLLLVEQILIHSCPWLVINCSPLAA